MVLQHRICCTYPLHPEYSRGVLPLLRHHRHLPPEQTAHLHPIWADYPVGVWHWCKRCTRQNERRTRYVRQLLAEAQQATRLMYKTTRHLPHILPGRCITKQTQDRYARQHCPTGMFWCARSLHYMPRAERSRLGWCTPCYQLSNIRQKPERLRRMRRERTELRAEFDTLAHDRATLRQEIRDLRNLKRAIDQEMLARPPAGPGARPPDDLSPRWAQHDDAPILHTPPRRDRRQAFGV